MRHTIPKHDADAWEAGFDAGEFGKPSRCPYQAGSVKAWSWGSGRVEGAAKRDGYSYSRGSLGNRKNPAHTVSNPSEPGALRDVNLITDRAKRYRAQGALEQSERLCIYCGKPETAGRRLDVDHIDGFEEHPNPENLALACRPCNVRKGHTLAAAKMGRKTRQRNPAGPGARTWQQYTAAAMKLRGLNSDMELQDAIQLMHDTPADKRSQFASQLYSHSRAHRAEHAGDVPF